MSDDVEKVRARINIVDVVGRRVNLKKSGRGYTGLCPFHDDKNPSMSVSATTGTYRCWSCGAKGDVFNFVMEMDRLTFREALEQLASECGVELTKRSSDPEIALRQRRESAMALAQDFFVEQWGKSTVAKDYCTGRGLEATICSDWGIGFAPSQNDPLATKLKKEGYTLQECQELFLVEKDQSGGYFDRFRSRLMFPIHDERGRLVAFGGRILGNGIPKYINSSDTPLFSKRRTLYGMHRARTPMADSGRAVLVEGYLDVIACHRAGVKEAVASLGTSLSEEHAQMIKKWAKEVVILYDADAAGQKAADRAEEILSGAGLRVRIALMPPGEDPDTLLRTAGPEAVKAAVEAGLSPTDFRMKQLRHTGDPQTEDFWEQAYEILSHATNAVDIERFAIELAGVYPGIRDRVAAERAIKKQIVAARRNRRTPAVTGATRPTRIPKAPVHPYEALVMRALLVEELAPRALAAIREDIFFTGEGIEAQGAISETLPTKVSGDPSKTIVPILPEAIQDILSMLESKAVLDVNADSLDGAIKSLKEKKEERDLQRRKSEVGDDDFSLKIIQESLEKLKNKET